MHRAKLLVRHRRVLKDKRVVVLGIRDEYGFTDPRLISLIQTKVRPWLPQ